MPLEPAQPEKVQIVGGLPILGQVGHYFADNATELEPVSGKSRGDADLGKIGMGIQDKMLVGGVGEQARLEGQRWPCRLREISPGKIPQNLLVVRMRLSIHPVRVYLLVQAAQPLEAQPG